MKVLKFPATSGSGGIPAVRIEEGGFFADIVWDRRGRPPAYYVIVQKHGSKAVLGIARYSSFYEARSVARSDLRVFAAEAA